MNQDPLPNVKAAYAHIRWKVIREIMKSESSLGNNSSEIGIGLATRGKPEFIKEVTKKNIKSEPIVEKWDIPKRSASN